MMTIKRSLLIYYKARGYVGLHAEHIYEVSKSLAYIALNRAMKTSLHKNKVNLFYFSDWIPLLTGT